MTSSTRRYWLRWLLVPPAAVGLVIFRGAEAVNDLRKRAQARLSRGSHRPTTRWAPGPASQGARLLAQMARERLVKMIAVAVFAVAAQSVIGGFAGGIARDLGVAPRAPRLERASAPGPRDAGPALSISLSADATQIAPGGTATYAIQIQHAPSAAGTVRNIVVSDSLPPEVEIASRPVCSLGSQDPEAQCNYDAASRTVTASISTLDGASEAAQIAFVVRAAESLSCGQELQNAASVTWNGNAGEPAQAGEATSTLTVAGSAAGDCAREAPGTSVASSSPAAPVAGVPSSDRAAPGTAPASTDYGHPGVYLDIPRLGLSQMEVVSMPAAGGSWNMSALGSSAGWVDSTGLPGDRGNSVIAAWGIDPQGGSGPFANLETLTVGDQVELRTPGDTYTYMVQSTRIVPADDTSVMSDSALPLMTLLAPSQWDPETGTYAAKVVVQAVLVKQGQ